MELFGLFNGGKVFFDVDWEIKISYVYYVYVIFFVVLFII